MVEENKLHKIFQGISQKMQTDFELLTSQFEHSLSIGESREFVLKEFLRQYLPARLGVEKGIIVSSVNGEEPSKQIDIVIYDKLNTPILYAADNLRIFPIEGVYVVIEVKSFLNVGDLQGGIDNIRSVKSMTKKAFIEQSGAIIDTVSLYGKKENYFPVLGFIFTYSSIKDVKLLKDKLEEGDDLKELSNNVDTICILDKAVITNKDLKMEIVVVTKEPDTIRGFIKTSDSLLLFYLLLMHVLPQTWMRPIKMADYAGKTSFGSLEM